MNNQTIDEKEDITEAVEDIFGKNYPEAPASMNVTAYYKGYKVQLTQRDPNVPLNKHMANAMTAINWMVENGFKPSWADDTNKQNGQSTMQKFDKQMGDQDNCDHVETVKQSTGHNKPENKGKYYKSCIKCNKWMGWTEV